MKINEDLLIGNTDTSLKDVSNDLSHLKPYVLFNTSSVAAADSYTLSDSAANYQYLEIFYQNTRYNSMWLYDKVFSPNGKTINLFSCGVGDDNGDTLWICTGRYTINGNKIVKNYEWGYRLTNGNWGLGNTIHGIGKIIGYK